MLKASSALTMLTSPLPSFSLSRVTLVYTKIQSRNRPCRVCVILV